MNSGKGATNNPSSERECQGALHTTAQRARARAVTNVLCGHNPSPCEQWPSIFWVLMRRSCARTQRFTLRQCRPAATICRYLAAGGGRVLMPGLSDMHWHAMMVRPTPTQPLASDIVTPLIFGQERPLVAKALTSRL